MNSTSVILGDLRFEVLTEVKTKITAFWMWRRVVWWRSAELQYFTSQRAFVLVLEDSACEIEKDKPHTFK
jgi:hypothetical protein